MRATFHQWLSKPVAWLALSVLIVAADYWTGPSIQFPILSLGPIALAVVYGGRPWGLPLAVGMPIALLAFQVHWDGNTVSLAAIVNACIRIAVLVTFAILIESAVRARALSKEVRVLRGILPICCHCKRIRTKEDSWVRIDAYITEHSEAQFSHGLCPDCLREHYPEEVMQMPGQTAATGSDEIGSSRSPPTACNGTASATKEQRCGS